MDLSPLIAAFILGIESVTWTYAGNKEKAVRDALDINMTRFYQLENALIDTELALLIDPQTTHRLQRIRSARMASRFGQRSA